MSSIDLTPFGFTPTESRIYEVLLKGGPGTGYAIAQTAGLARANTYSALEGLVAKGAALMEGDRPRRFRPEAPATLLTRLTNRQSQELERLSEALKGFGAPVTPTIVEVDSPRGALQVISHDIARARESVQLLAPADAYPLLSPTLRRVVALGLEHTFVATAPVELPFASVLVISTLEWPGEPLVAITDNQTALIAVRNGSAVHGHWSASPPFVAAARHTISHLKNPV
ncbi:MAG: helix-turn-helix domain-containing protein [Gemmatimonadota bacterium]